MAELFVESRVFFPIYNFGFCQNSCGYNFINLYIGSLLFHDSAYLFYTSIMFLFCLFLCLCPTVWYLWSCITFHIYICISFIILIIIILRVLFKNDEHLNYQVFVCAYWVLVNLIKFLLKRIILNINLVFWFRICTLDLFLTIS